MVKTKGKILVVDDSLMNIESIKESLESFDYEICGYTNPLEALQQEKNSQIDLAMIDVAMPDIDGVSFVEKFISCHQNTSIVFFCDTNQKGDEIKGYDLNTSVYIEKPFDEKVLCAQIQSILNLKAVQDELLCEKEKLSCVFEFSSNEMILTDVEFNIISQNNKILPLDSSKNFLKIILKRANSYYLNDIKSFIHSRENHLHLQFVFDEKMHIKATFSKIKSNNVITGFLIILEDLTEEIEKERLQRGFVDILNHHLKTPVRAEKRALQLLLENSFGVLSSEQKDIVGEILNSTRCMLHMMDNIVTRYKLDSKQFIVNKSPNSIKRSIQSCLENLDYLFKSRNQTVKINSLIEGEENYVLEYDELEIKRALKNLIYNASEYSPVSSEINIVIKKDEENIQITVKDEGMGLPEDILESIMNETYYGQTFKKVGAGQGLYITKKIIEAHGGRIQIESAAVTSASGLSKGTSFTFYLPCLKSLSKSIVQS